MLIHVFLLRKNPGEWQNHKCTHFNIINIIWLPLCSPRCPGFYLPMAAEEESENRFYIPCAGSHPRALPAWQKSNSLSSQTRQTGTETRNSSAFTQETSPERQQTCSEQAACAQPHCQESPLPRAGWAEERGCPNAVPQPHGPSLDLFSPFRANGGLGNKAWKQHLTSCSECDWKSFSLLQRTVTCARLYPPTFHFFVKEKTGFCIF